MRYFVTAFLFGLTGGCAHVDRQAVSRPAICDRNNREISNFADLDVVVVLDQHGGYAALKMCPDRAFSVDFSNIPLNNAQYSPLLHHMDLNVVLGGPPTEMRVSGVIRRVSGERDTMVFTRIISYNLH
jgi:hypothetical protein